jgi:hypothetical protein
MSLVIKDILLNQFIISLKLRAMKKNPARGLSAFILILFNTSCVHYYYAPNTNNVPLFKEKNEARIQAQYSSVSGDQSIDEIANGLELQTAYAVGKHLGLQFNYLNASYTDVDYGSGSGNYFEAAAGYFNPSKNKYWIFETYAGIGSGVVKNIYKTDIGEETAKTSFTKFFIQPSYGYCRKHFAMALSSKISFVNFSASNSTLTQDAHPQDFNFIESFRNGKSYVWLEPGLLIRGGFKSLQATFQVTYSIHDDSNMPFYNLNSSIGIVVPFNIKSKQASTK